MTKGKKKQPITPAGDPVGDTIKPAFLAFYATYFTWPHFR